MYLHLDIRRLVAVSSEVWSTRRHKHNPLHDPVTCYGINYAGTQIKQWTFQNKRPLTSAARLSYVLKVPLRYLRPSVIYPVPCHRILLRAYCKESTASCPISKARIIGFSFSFLFFSFFILPGNVSDFFFVTF